MSKKETVDKNKATKAKNVSKKPTNSKTKAIKKEPVKTQPKPTNSKPKAVKKEEVVEALSIQTDQQMTLEESDTILVENDQPIDDNQNSNQQQSLDNNQEQINENLTQSLSHPSEANITFFEKFEKTKKDMLKERRAEKQKVLKSLRSKNKVLGFDNRLRDDEFIKNSWIGFIVSSILFLVYACVCLGFLVPTLLWRNPKWSFAHHYGDMTKTIIVFSSTVAILIPIPYIYLMGSWFVGVNGIYKSKHFFIMIFSIIIISLVLMILIVPMSSVIFGKVNGFRPLIPDGSTGGGDETPPPPEEAFSLLMNYIN